MIKALVTAGTFLVAPIAALAQAPCATVTSPAEVESAQARLQTLAWVVKEPNAADGATADCLFDSLRQRNQARPLDWRNRYKLAMRLWDFDTARRLKATAPGEDLFAGQAAPEGAIAAPQPVPLAPVWRFDPTTGVLREQAMSEPTTFKLAFFFRPSCGFCQRAVVYIAKSERLSRLMSSCGLWTAQMDHGTDIDALRQWSTQQRGAAIWAIRDWRSYGVAEPEATPTFFAIRGGQVVGEVVGWPKEGNEAALLELARTHDPEHRCQ